MLFFDALTVFQTWFRHRQHRPSEDSYRLLPSVPCLGKQQESGRKCSLLYCWTALANRGSRFADCLQVHLFVMMLWSIVHFIQTVCSLQSYLLLRHGSLRHAPSQALQRR